MYDKDGNALYKMTEPFSTICLRMFIQGCEYRETAFTPRKKGFISMFGTKTITCWERDDDGGEPYLEAREIFSKRTTRYLMPSRERSLSEYPEAFHYATLFIDKDTYIIRVEAGVDAALLVCLVLAMKSKIAMSSRRKRTKAKNSLR